MLIVNFIFATVFQKLLHKIKLVMLYREGSVLYIKESGTWKREMNVLRRRQVRFGHRPENIVPETRSELSTLDPLLHW